jgi:acyl-coenzyme A synthetase/AMP-(fatty) acid ligase
MQLQFWSSDHFNSLEGVAIASESNAVSYLELDRMISDYMVFLSEHRLDKKLAFLPMKSDISSVIRYLACLRVGIVPLLLPKDIDESLMQNLRAIYEPAVSFGLSGLYDIEIHNHIRPQVSLPKDLTLLLSTSGSTGSPKLVKLSSRNLQTNAKSISQYLNIGPGQKAHCSLPLSYSYGLSVLNSHLQSGACVYLSELNPLSAGYYDELIRENITSMSGVPFFYQMLFRTGFFDKDIPSLKVMTQAGGKLSDKLLVKYSDYADQNNLNFYVMYGQTEATARISYVPCEILSQKIGSVGVAIPGGKLELSDESELIYFGPNVMIGYAKTSADLFKKGQYLSSLQTGDIAQKDEDGFYYITGRLKRFLKLAGSRFGLDEIETFLEDEFDDFFLATGKDDKLIIMVENHHLDKTKVLKKLQDKYSINRSFIKVQEVEEIMRKANGKKDYSFYRENIDGK